jgi:uncharacterized protein YjbI with pentapeptide repeats
MSHRFSPASKAVPEGSELSGRDLREPDMCASALVGVNLGNANLRGALRSDFVGLHFRTRGISK